MPAYYRCALLLLLLGPMSSAAQPVDYSARTYALCFLGNMPLNAADPLLRLYLSSPVDANGTVRTAGTSIPFSVAAGGISEIDLSGISVYGGEVVENNGVIIESDVPLTVVGLNSIRNFSDAFGVRPLASLGRRYVVASWKGDTTVASSDFAVVAPFDATTLRITTPDRTTRTVTLNALQTWGMHTLTGDLTGTVIEASQPVAVFSGARLAAVPRDSAAGTDAYGHMAEQLIPVSKWDASALIVPHPSPSHSWSSRFRVIAAFDSTVVRVNNQLWAYLNAGTSFEARINESKLVSANMPIQVMQYEMSARDTVLGNPFMMQTPPMAQYRPSYDFISVPFDSFSVHTVLISVPAPQRRSLRLDGAPLPDTMFFVYNGPSAHSYALLEVEPGRHTLESITGTPFAMMVCGYGEFNAYGYTPNLDTLRLLESFDRDAPSLLSSDFSGCDLYTIRMLDTGEIVSGLVPELLSVDVDGGRLERVDTAENGTAVLITVRLDNRESGAVVIVNLSDAVGNAASYTIPATINRPVVMVDPNDELVVPLATGSVDCDSISVHNPGDRPLVIRYASFMRNIRFSIPPSALPITIPPGAGMLLPVCIDGRGDAEPFERDTLMLFDSCGTLTRQAVRFDRTALAGTDGCGTQLTVDPTGGASRMVARVVPNPTFGNQLIVQLRSAEMPVRLELISVTGTTVRSVEISSEPSLHEVYFDVSGIPPGNYWLRARSRQAEVLQQVGITR